jgi:mannitol-1-phosphate/altronate dehydrogenase
MELEKQWLAKLYLHNTPHCIAAYLGSMLSLTYVHEALKNPRVSEIVAGAMGEMKHVLRCRFSLEPAFVDWYADKELQRFRNTLLYDPIDRVAREPFRKLAPNERLIGAAQLCICCGIVPEKIMLGIMTAFCYDNPRDPDANIRYLMRALQPPEFLIVAMQLRSGEALYELLLDRWDANLNLLQEISDG